jgi:N-terminal acetyltransferase B complex non-catalytic subunit
MSSLSASLVNLLHHPNTGSRLTAAEELYYTILSLLPGIVVLGLTAKSSDPCPRSLSDLLTSLQSCLASLHTACFSRPPSDLDQVAVLYSIADQHSMSMLREASLTVKQTAGYLLAFGEREAARDRSGKSSLLKQVLVEMRALEKLAAKELACIKSHVKTLKGSLSEPGWLDRLVEWTMGADGEGADDAVAGAVFAMVGGRAAVEEWAGRVLESWREGIREWDLMKMD